MEKLTMQEEEVMQAIWKTGEGIIKSFMEKMKSPGPYTTVASTIRNLEKKKYITGKSYGTVKVYKPLIEEQEYKNKFMGVVVEDYFENSYKELVSFFIMQKKLSAEDLQELINMIEEGKS